MRPTMSFVVSCALMFAGLSTGRAESDVYQQAYQEAAATGFAPICLGGGNGDYACSPRDSIPSTFAWLNHPAGSLLERFANGKDRRAYFCRSGARPVVVRGMIRELFSLSDNAYEQLPSDEARKAAKTVLRPSWQITCAGNGDIIQSTLLTPQQTKVDPPPSPNPATIAVPPVAAPPSVVRPPVRPAPAGPAMTAPEPVRPQANPPDMGVVPPNSELDRAIDQALQAHPNP